MAKWHLDNESCFFSLLPSKSSLMFPQLGQDRHWRSSSPERWFHSSRLDSVLSAPCIMCVQLSLYEYQIIKIIKIIKAVSGLHYPRRCRLDNSGRGWVWGCALTNKADDRSHSGSVLIRQNSRKNSWILKPSIFRCNSSGLKAFCSLNCSKNKYFRRGLNLNVKDSVFYASVFVEGAGQKSLFSLNLHALNPN